jgi:hypothetical protein
MCDARNQVGAHFEEAKMRLTLKHRVLNAKERKGWHSFFVEIYDDGNRVYEPLNMVADPKDKAKDKYRAARQFCQDVIAKRQIELSSIAAGELARKTWTAQEANG